MILSDTLQRHRRSHQESSSSSVETPAPGVQDSENGPTIGLDLQSEMRLTRQPHVSFEEPSEPHNTRMTTRNLTPNQPLNASNLNTTVSNDEAELRPNNAPAPAWDTLSLADDLNCSPGVPVSLGADELAPALALRECTSNAEYATSDIDAWDTAFDHNWAAWSVGQNFDLDAMNAAIAAAVELHHAPKRGLFNSEQEHPFEDDTLLTRRHQSTQKTMETIERSWISFSYPSTESNVLTGTVTPTNENDTGEKNDIDELYRYNLSSRLQHRPYDNSLPSTDFLNLSVRLYFSRFHPIFPLVHAPTFRPSMVKSLLLLSICSIGSLFMGSSSASLQGTRIFETLNKCIINSWDRYLARSRAEALSMIQASLLGQTFAILSGVPARLNLAQAYHGTIVAWSRQAKMFKETPSDLFNTSKDTGPGGLENVWRNWVQSQQHIRLVLGIQIHDAELAMMFHHEPLLRHEKEAFRTSSSEQLFNANSASSWLTMAQKVQKSERSGPISTLSSNIAHYLNMFDEYAKLDGINAAIHESRQQNRLGTQKQSQYAKDLMNWQKGAKELWKNPSSDSMCLTILWHAAFISLFTDFDKIEAVIGRDGPFGANQSQIYVTEWASSASAERCLAHALLLQRKVESIQFGQEPAIHVPRCLFQASLVWYMYGRHIPPNTSHPPLEFPEFKLIGAVMPQNMIPWNRREFGKLTALEFSTLSTLKDLLQRLGRWGLSKRYGSILGLLIEDKDHKT